MGCLSGIIKYLLGTFNLIFTLSGLVIIGLGTWAYIWLNNLLNNEDIPDIDLRFLGIVVIAVGCILFIIAFFGCCGAFTESKCMLFIYALIVMALAAGKIFLTIFLNSGVNSLKTTTETFLNDTFTDYPQLFNGMELLFRCCGTTGPESYEGIYPLDALPPTCCNEPLDNLDTICPVEEAFGGCNRILTDLIANVGGAFTGVLVALIIVEIVIISLTFYLCCSVSSRKRRYY